MSAVLYEEEEVAKFPVLAVEQCGAVGLHAGWNISQVYLYISCYTSSPRYFSQADVDDSKEGWQHAGRATSNLEAFL